MTDLFGNPALIVGFAIPSALGASLFHGVAQTGYQPIATAKNNKEVKKSIWFAGPINGCFCILPALIGSSRVFHHYLPSGRRYDDDSGDAG